MSTSHRLFAPVVALLTVLAVPTAGSAAAAAPSSRLPVGAGWSPLGAELLPTSNDTTYQLSVATGPRGLTLLNTTIADPSYEAAVNTISQWSRDGWKPFGEPHPTPGGEVTVDRYGGLWMCTVGRYGDDVGGPRVYRWTSQGWSQLGGGVSTEVGHTNTGRHYALQSCTGPVLDASGAPVLGWVAHVGSKADFAYAARWDEAAGHWVAFEEGLQDVGERNNHAELVTDRRGELYLATSRPGGGYGGSYTTRVYHWDGAAWVTIGEWLDTTNSVLAVGRDGVYAGHRVRETGQVEILRWRESDGTWEPVASPGAANSLRLAVTRSGRLLAVLVDDFDELGSIRVVALRGERWRQLGGLLDEPTGAVDQVDLAVDSLDRPVVAWVERGIGTGCTGRVVRYHLPALLG